MNYKETLFFVGKCLTISHEKQNKILVEEELKSGKTNWDSVVKISTAHYVFPALYCNLKRANFLHYLPEDLVDYMKHITDLNRDRNTQIIAQAKEINDLLLSNNIDPIFLKGTGNLLEGLYEDIGERMVGDIDIIVSKNNYLKTANIIRNYGYKPIKETDNARNFHWHYPRLVNKNKICALEIHKSILKKNYDYILSFSKIKTNLIKQSGFLLLSNENKIQNALLPKIINDNLYYPKKISLRTMYDVYLITQKGDYIIKINNQKISTKFNDFFGCIKMVLNNPKSINVKENKSLINYKKSYLSNLNNSRKKQIKTSLYNYYTRWKNRFDILRLSFTDKEYRNYVKKRIFEIEFYKNISRF